MISLSCHFNGNAWSMELNLINTRLVLLCFALVFGLVTIEPESRPSLWWQITDHLWLMRTVHCRMFFREFFIIFVQNKHNRTNLIKITEMFPPSDPTLTRLSEPTWWWRVAPCCSSSWPPPSSPPPSSCLPSSRMLSVSYSEWGWEWPWLCFVCKRRVCFLCN